MNFPPCILLAGVGVWIVAAPASRRTVNIKYNLKIISSEQGNPTASAQADQFLYWQFVKAERESQKANKVSWVIEKTALVPSTKVITNFIFNL